MAGLFFLVGDRLEAEAAGTQVAGKFEPVNFEIGKGLIDQRRGDAALPQILTQAQQAVAAFDRGTDQDIEIAGFIKKTVFFEPAEQLGEIGLCLFAELALQLAGQLTAGIVTPPQPVQGGMSQFRLKLSHQPLRFLQMPG